MYIVSKHPKNSVISSFPAILAFFSILVSLASCESEDEATVRRYLPQIEKIFVDRVLYKSSEQMKITSANCIQEVYDDLIILKEKDPYDFYRSMFLTDVDLATLEADRPSIVYEKILKKDKDYPVQYRVINAFASGRYIYVSCSNETQEKRTGPSKVELLVFEVIDGKVYYYDDRTVKLLKAFIETLEQNDT